LIGGPSMKKRKYLGRDDWMLPLADTTHCEMNDPAGKTVGYHCDASGIVYYPDPPLRKSVR
jgi:hypothetical protein